MDFGKTSPNYVSDNWSFTLTSESEATNKLGEEDRDFTERFVA